MFNNIIYTRRLALRKIREDDLPLIQAWSNNPAAYGNYLTPERFSQRRIRELFAMNGFWRDRDKTFLIETLDPSTPIGTLHYWLRNDPPKTAVLNVKIAETGQREKGYGTEAQKFVVIHLFEQVGVQRVLLYVDIENRAEQRCLQKLGFSISRSLMYDDRDAVRNGFEFELDSHGFLNTAIYRFHYE